MSPHEPLVTNRPWHSTRATDSRDYHSDTRCPDGAAIAGQDRQTGEGERHPCIHCTLLRLEALKHPVPRAPRSAGAGMR